MTKHYCDKCGKETKDEYYKRIEIKAGKKHYFHITIQGSTYVNWCRACASKHIIKQLGGKV